MFSIIIPLFGLLSKSAHPLCVNNPSFEFNPALWIRYVILQGAQTSSSVWDRISLLKSKWTQDIFLLLHNKSDLSEPNVKILESRGRCQYMMSRAFLKISRQIWTLAWNEERRVCLPLHLASREFCSGYSVKRYQTLARYRLDCGPTMDKAELGAQYLPDCLQRCLIVNLCFSAYLPEALYHRLNEASDIREQREPIHLGYNWGAAYLPRSIRVYGKPLRLQATERMWALTEIFSQKHELISCSVLPEVFLKQPSLPLDLLIDCVQIARRILVYWLWTYRRIPILRPFTVNL